MKIFHSTQDFKSLKKTIITIGTFDGVHIGHQKIISNIVQNCKDDNLESAILTFFPHPRMVLNENSDIKLLNTIAEKTTLLQDFGIQNLVIQKFDANFSELSAEKFVKNILVDQLNVQKIIIGHDHRFGKNRSANFDDLLIFGKHYSFEVEQICVQEVNDIAVSSTKIRSAIEEGNVMLANHFLGYQYQINGEVVHGKKLGRTIGFPTANIQIIENYKLIPKFGVYLIQSMINEKVIYGIINIGVKPTFDIDKPTIEVHFLDFNADLYDQNLTISFIAFIRNEQKIESIDALKNQINNDKQFALNYLSNNLKISL